ncbi:MAG: hypothetical protein LBT51_00195 [Fusobacteriaceae bacterium]|nr:hypothetical protein [Fusobacteriaceae bacterium]
MIIELNPQELEQAKGDPNIMASMLVRKAIVEEMSKREFTNEEKFQLEIAKKNLEIEFFLNILAQKDIKIEDHEILKIYQENAESLKDKNMVEIFPQLRQALFNQKLGEAKVKVINSFIEQYKLNDVLKEYAPASQQPAAATTENIAPIINTEVK